MGCKKSKIQQPEADSGADDGERSVPIPVNKKTRRDSVAIHKKHLAKRATADRGERSAPAGMKVEVYD